MIQTFSSLSYYTKLCYDIDIQHKYSEKIGVRIIERTGRGNFSQDVKYIIAVAQWSYTM